MAKIRRALRNFVTFSLGSITRPGSLGIISARYLEHPFETGQRYN